MARGIPSAVAVGRWGRGLLDLATGGPVEALGHLEALSRGGPEGGSRFYALLSAPDLIEAAARAGEPDTGKAALSRLEQWATHAALPWALALVARSRALLSGGDRADRHFADAVRLHADGRRPFDRARTELLFGEYLRRARRRVDARPHLRSALETFQRLGAVPWEERARSELRASGESARKRDVSTIEQLTPQELQVVRLVVQGATNKEAAAQLFLSPRTIDYHLRNVFTKFGLTSRAELIRLDVLQEPSGGLAGT
jgi:DNA-binding CsgD family transcriptional regulator